MGSLARCLSVVAFVVSVGLVQAQNCKQSTQPAVPADDFNAVFTQNGPGWTGADSTYSRALPDGRTAYFFSDSFLASSPVPNGATVVPETRTRSNPIFQGHNSIVIRNPDGTLNTLYGGNSLNPTSLFVPANTNDLLWMGDSVVLQTAPGIYTLKLLLLEFNASTYAFVGTSVATMSLPDLTVQSVQPLAIAGGVEWGSAIVQVKDELYVYGVEDLPSGKYPHVSRLSSSELANPDTWQFWNGSDWVSGAINSARIINAPDSISNEFNVNQIHAAGGNSYVLTAMDTSVAFGTWKDIIFYYSCSPQGPWSAKQVVYSTPETGTADHSGQGKLLTYNPHAHFESAGQGSVLISYDLNTTNGNDLIFADDYRPKFVRVPILGLK